MILRTTSFVILAGCFTPYSQLPSDRADPKLRKIEDATIIDMKVHLHKQPGLCPGKAGKLYVNANVRWPGAAKPVVRSLGSDVDSLQPGAFKISGPLLRADANAHLVPDANVLASVQSGFDVKVVYKPDPKFSFALNFPPEYSCYQGWYVDGAVGGGGAGGRSGNGGDWGQSGESGTPGERGGRGRDGGQIKAFVTIVSTKYYPRLIAVIANDSFFLAPADRALEFGATGGQGGPGGEGGSGGQGGDQPVEDKEVYDDAGTKTTIRVPVGAPGNGGSAANGGSGGVGGNGGTIEVTYDSRFPELQRLIKTDVRGGAGGDGGAAGNPGNGGGSSADRDPAYGNPGVGARGGEDGGPGQAGRASVRPGSVARMFALPGLATPGAGATEKHKRRRR